MKCTVSLNTNVRLKLMGLPFIFSGQKFNMESKWSEFLLATTVIVMSVTTTTNQDPLMGSTVEPKTDSPLKDTSPALTDDTTAVISPSRTTYTDITRPPENVSQRLNLSTVTQISNRVVTSALNESENLAISRLEIALTTAEEGPPRKGQSFTETMRDKVTLTVASRLIHSTESTTILPQKQMTHSRIENIHKVDSDMIRTEIMMTEDYNSTVLNSTNQGTVVLINDTICEYACSLIVTTTGNETFHNSSTDTMYSDPATMSYFTLTTAVPNLLLNSTGNDTGPTLDSQYQNVFDPEVCKICRSQKRAEEPTEKTLYYRRVTERIWRNCPPLLFFIGTIGNVLSGVVMMRRSLRTSITSFFLVTLAVVDTFMLWNGLMRQYPRYAHSIFVRSHSLAACRLHIFLTYWGGQFAAWILVCMTMERFFAIFSPHKSKQYVSKLSCGIVVGVIGVLLAGLNEHFFKTHLLVFYYGRYYCVTDSNYGDFMQQIWTWIDFAFFSFIPFGILVIANAGIILRIAHSNYVRKHNMKQSSGGVKMTSMTAILLTVSLIFLLTTAPISIYLVIQENVKQSTTQEERALNSLWWAIVVNVNYVNHACNFFLYCISGPRFRRELRGMFGLHRQVYPATVTQTMENSVKTQGLTLPHTASSNV